MKRLFSLLLAVVLSLGLMPTAFAASDEATEAAETLYELGLFSGTGTNADGTPIFDLDRTPTRHEAVTMLVAMLGKTEEAKNGTWTTPFTDVADWAKPFVGYAYSKGLTSGTSATTYGGNQPVTAGQYLTFVLTALGYKSGTDFQWDKAWELSDQIGLTHGEYGAQTPVFTRGDVAIISRSAHEVQQVIETAPYWGLPSDIKWIANCQTMEEMDNNILYSFLFGNYSLNFTQHPFMNQTALEARRFLRESVNNLSTTYSALMGAYTNHRPGCGITEKNVLFIDFPKSSLSTETVYTQQLEALDKALEIKEALHQSGKIKPNMSEKQIAQVYYDYLSSMRVERGGGSEAASEGRSAEYDTAYACLINKKADCVGKAAAFELLVHLEGISAHGVGGQMKNGGGHRISRVVLDGKEYFCDWGNKKGITQDVSSWFEFDEESLAAARAAG